MDITKQAEINNFVTTLTLGIAVLELSCIYVWTNNARRLRGLRWTGSYHTPLIPKDRFNPSLMVLKRGTSLIMNGLMIIKMDTLSVSTVLVSGLPRMLDREKQTW